MLEFLITLVLAFVAPVVVYAFSRNILWSGATAQAILIACFVAHRFARCRHTGIIRKRLAQQQMVLVSLEVPFSEDYPGDIWHSRRSCFIEARAGQVRKLGVLVTGKLCTLWVQKFEIGPTSFPNVTPHGS